MADSDIVLSGLTIKPGLAQNVLDWVIDDPNADGLPPLQLAAVEIWWATTNNRSGALQIGEVAGTQFVHGGLTGIAQTQTHYYWIRARNRAGYHGEWEPQGATSGADGLPLQPASITASKLKSAADGLPRIVSDVNFLTCYGDDGVTELVRVGPTGSFSDYLKVENNEGEGAFACWFQSSITTTVNVRCEASVGHGIASLATGTGFAFYSAGGGYGPFTGAHDAIIAKPITISPGDVVATVRIVARRGVSDTLREVAPSSRPYQRGARGVFVARGPISELTPFAAGGDFLHLAEKYDRAIFNGVGEGLINVCGEAGDIRAGDLLVTSSTRGKAMRQGDDIVRAATVASADEDVIFSRADECRQIACIYLSG